MSTNAVNAASEIERGMGASCIGVRAEARIQCAR